MQAFLYQGSLALRRELYNTQWKCVADGVFFSLLYTVIADIEFKFHNIVFSHMYTSRQKQWSHAWIQQKPRNTVIVKHLLAQISLKQVSVLCLWKCIFLNVLTRFLPTKTKKSVIAKQNKNFTHCSPGAEGSCKWKWQSSGIDFEDFTGTKVDKKWKIL